MRGILYHHILLRRLLQKENIAFTCNTDLTLLHYRSCSGRPQSTFVSTLFSKVAKWHHGAWAFRLDRPLQYLFTHNEGMRESSLVLFVVATRNLFPTHSSWRACCEHHGRHNKGMAAPGLLQLPSRLLPLAHRMHSPRQTVLQPSGCPLDSVLQLAISAPPLSVPSVCSRARSGRPVVGPAPRVV